MSKKKITLSIVSHRNCQDILTFLKSNQIILDKEYLSIIIRINIPEDITELREITYKNASFEIISNKTPMGFGQNHNKNFEVSHSPDREIFIVCNPDLTIISDNIFVDLLASSISIDKCIYTPRILNEDFSDADYRRGPIYFSNLLKRFLLNKKNGDNTFLWTPSVFKCFPSTLFKNLDGYDDNIFMYYEDYDICMRARAAGSKVKIMENNYVIHKAARSSRKSLKLLQHHLVSIYYVTRKKKRNDYR